MPEPSFAADLRSDGADAVVVLRGDLDLATVPRLDAVLATAFGSEGDVERVVVDMAAVEFIDSSGLTALVKGNRQAADLGLALVIRAPSDRVLRTLQLTQLDTVLVVEG